MAPGYHRLSIAEKEAHQRAAVREPSVTCPGCDTHVMPSDLLAHVAKRCKGPREPGPGARWVSWRDAIAAGVPERSLVRWSRRGEIRFRGGWGDRQYLLRDLALRVAQLQVKRRINRRR